MTASKLDRFSEILLVRRLQRDVAERLAGKAADTVRELEADRLPLRQARDETIAGYRDHLTGGRFDPMMAAGWLNLVAREDEALTDHDAHVDLARSEADDAERGWHRARGQESLAGDLTRQARRWQRRRAEEQRMADHADRILQQGRGR